MTKIRVETFEIETKDIVKITDAGRRRIGFKIHLVGGREIDISRHEPYDMMPMDVGKLHRPYDRLRKQVEEKWAADKSGIETLCL